MRRETIESAAIFDIYERVDVNGRSEVFLFCRNDVGCADVVNCERECSDIYSGSSEGSNVAIKFRAIKRHHSI